MPGPARAIGPVEAAGDERDDGRAGAASTSVSATPRPQPARRDGTRRSRVSTGSRVTRRTASSVSVGEHPGGRERRSAPGRAGSRRERSRGGTRCAPPQQSTTAATTPSGTPARVTGSSSRSSSVAGAGPAASRSRASATSGRRCSVAAASTSQSTTTASSPSWSISSGIVTRDCSRSGGYGAGELRQPRVDLWRPFPVVAAFCADRSTSSIRGPSSISWSIPVAATSSG